MSKSQRRVGVIALLAAALTLVLIKASSAPAYAGSTPSAPGDVVAVPGDRSVTVSFSGSASSGTSPIIYYRVSVFENGHDTDFYADGTTSPITVTGLTAGVTYTAKVKARNGSGFGGSSKPTPPFTPAADGFSTSSTTAGGSATGTTVPPTATSTAPSTTRSTTATSTRSASATTGTTSAAAAAGATLLPANVLDLHAWRLGLPTDARDGTSGKSLEIKQPKLLTYAGANFHVNADGGGVVFTAGVGGATTSGSKYPRSELRELSPSGALAAWSPAGGTHTMTITGSVDHLPVNKPQVVAAQIHTTHASDAFELMATGPCSEDHCGSRYAGIPRGTVQLVTKENGNQSSGVVDPNYVLGSRYTVAIQVTAGGRTTITYKNLTSGHTSTRSFTLASGDTEYFKAGCYTQSNLSHDSSSAYGQTTINAITVTHSG